MTQEELIERLKETIHKIDEKHRRLGELFRQVINIAMEHCDDDGLSKINALIERK